MGRNQHVIPHQGRWAVRGAGNSRATGVFSSRNEAITAGRRIARNQRSELVVHGSDGRIRNKTSFGNHPHSLDR